MSALKIWHVCKETLWVTLGLALYAGSWNVFVLPHSFVGGGFGGISAMVFYQTHIPIAVSYLGFNVILCLIAYAVLGRDFSIKTVLGIFGLTFFLQIICPAPIGTDTSAVDAFVRDLFGGIIIPAPDKPVIADKLLSAIMGGIIGGTGVAFYLLHGASTGGSDIIVMIVSKYKNISWGRVYLMFDSCVILSSLMLPESTIETVAYGFVFMGVNVYTVDMISNGLRQSVQMFIFTSKYREVADQIIHYHHRGATLFESIGWFTKQHRKTIFLVARKRESESIFRSVKAIDPNAFIAVSNVMSVFGMGFDAIKAGFSKAVLKDEEGNVLESDPARPKVSIEGPVPAPKAAPKAPEEELQPPSHSGVPISSVMETVPAAPAPLSADFAAVEPDAAQPEVAESDPVDNGAEDKPRSRTHSSMPRIPLDRHSLDHAINMRETVPSISIPDLSMLQFPSADDDENDDEEYDDEPEDANDEPANAYDDPISEDDTMTFAPLDPRLHIDEVALDSQDTILDDEIHGLALENAGKGAEYNPNWETPASELIDIPELTELSPEDKARQVIHRPGSDNQKRTPVSLTSIPAASAAVPQKPVSPASVPAIAPISSAKDPSAANIPAAPAALPKKPGAASIPAAHAALTKKPGAASIPAAPAATKSLPKLPGIKPLSTSLSKPSLPKLKK